MRLPGIAIFFLIMTSCTPSVEELVDRAIKLSDKGKYKEAIDIYSKLIEKNYKLQIPYYNRGICYMALEDYRKALDDFNTVISSHEIGDFIISYNSSSPLATEEARAQVPYNEAIYQKAQTLYYMDSLRSSFNEFNRLVAGNYLKRKSNCLDWQGSIWLRTGDSAKACICFEQARQFADNESDKTEAENLIKEYCR